jgi:hypothetical protein
MKKKDLIDRNFPETYENLLFIDKRNLTSLKGSPNKINNSFYCNNNLLTIRARSLLPFRVVSSSLGGPSIVLKLIIDFIYNYIFLQYKS